MHAANSLGLLLGRRGRESVCRRRLPAAELEILKALHVPRDHNRKIMSMDGSSQRPLLQPSVTTAAAATAGRRAGGRSTGYSVRTQRRNSAAGGVMCGGVDIKLHTNLLMLSGATALGPWVWASGLLPFMAWWCEAAVWQVLRLQQHQSKAA